MQQSDLTTTVAMTASAAALPSYQEAVATKQRVPKGRVARGILSAVLALYHIICMTWGFNYLLEECEQSLDIWLIVSGCTGLLAIIVNNFYYLYKVNSEAKDLGCQGRLPWLIMLAVPTGFYIAWIYVGAYWSLLVWASISKTTCPVALTHFSYVAVAANFFIPVILAAPNYFIVWSETVNTLPEAVVYNV